MVLDHETWVMNLEQANRNGYANWYLLYTAKQAYKLRNLHPQEWDRLIYRMLENEDLFFLYYRYKILFIIW